MTRIAIAFAGALALMAGSGCKDKSTQPTSSDVLARMAELKDKMCACKDADCAKQVSDDMLAWAKQQGQHKSPTKLSDADQTKAAELGRQMGECEQKLAGMGAGDAAPASTKDSAGAPGAPAGVAEGSAAPAEQVAGLPKECDDYKAAIDKLATCDKISKQARETLVKAYADASAGWKALPEAAKAKIGVSCKAGAEAVLSAAKAQCGWE